MSLFSDIYNTVAKFFRGQEEQNEDASKSVATNRLKLVLMQDRTNLTPKILEQMRGELIDLLSRYVELDKDLLDLNFEQEGNQVALMLSIPVIRAKDEDEIEAAIKERNETIAKTLSETADTSQENDDNTGDKTDISEETNEEYSNEETIEIKISDSDECSEESQQIEAEKQSLNNKKVSKPKDISANNPKTEPADNIETV